VALFIDDISILLAYLGWGWCPTAGGQESSTRYIRLDPSSLTAPDLLGVPEEDQPVWRDFMRQSFDAYSSALDYWEAVGRANPELTRIPHDLIEDESDKAQRTVARMRRNYAFDRARYFLPAAAKTNMMLVMSARAWVQLCQNLTSHYLPEAVQLGTEIRSALEMDAPRLVRHAGPAPSFVAGHKSELNALRLAALSLETAPKGEAPCVAEVNVMPPGDSTEGKLLESLAGHDNRYAFTGAEARRTAIRFSWSAVALAEIRDLNRHRTGQKHCVLAPRGFYCGEDQLPNRSIGSSLPSAVGDLASAHSPHRALSVGLPGGLAWILLGTQFSFEHVTTREFKFEVQHARGS